MTTMKLALLWCAVVLEMALPVPGVLSLGAAYVLLLRPPWFERMVRELYARERPQV